MEPGKIKKWIKDKGYGFIVDDLGEDVFFHINSSQALKGKEESLVEGAVVVFDKTALPETRRPVRGKERPFTGPHSFFHSARSRRVQSVKRRNTRLLLQSIYLRPFSSASRCNKSGRICRRF